MVSLLPLIVAVSVLSPFAWNAASVAQADSPDLASGNAPVQVVARRSDMIPSLSTSALDESAPTPTPAAQDDTDRKEVVAWIPYWDQALAVKSAIDHRDTLTGVSLFWYGLSSDGRVVAFPGAENNDVLVALRQAGLQVYALVSNDYDAVRVRGVTKNADARAAHVADLVQRAADYDGIELDYEGLYPADRDAYSALVAELADALHAIGKRLVLAVHASTGPKDNWAGPGGHDLKALGQSADELRIMAYDYHWMTSQPGPVSPISWVERVLKYATTQVPRFKLLLGVPFYGYDWGPGNTRAVEWTDVQAILSKFKITPTDNGDGSGPHFTYISGGAKREVWFEDEQSLAARVDLAQEYGLKGIAAWRLGGEDPGFWDVLGSLEP